MSVDRLRWTTTVDVEVDIDKLAELFSAMDDDQQAQFFCKVAALARDWKQPAGMQWWYIGGHLVDCSCSTEEGRQMVQQIAASIETHSQERRIT